MGIVKEVIKHQIDENNLQYVYSATGKIVRYDKVYNTADIVYDNPVGDGSYSQIGVPISNSLGGLTSGGIRPGQTCIITFMNGNVQAPLITGVSTGTYFEKDHKDQGAYIADERIRETINTVPDIVPMYQDWIDNSNTWTDKYKTHEVDYSNVNARQMMQQIIESTENFSDTEIGLTHLDTKSTIKLKDNGDIDIFVADNVGIRISREMRKIYFYGFDLNINGEMDLLAILRKCRDCNGNNSGIRDVINKYINYIEGDIEELKRCIAYTKEITGDDEYFNTLDDAIYEFEELKRDYNEGKYNDDTGLEDVRSRLMAYAEYFKEELASARERWGLS